MHNSQVARLLKGILSLRVSNSYLWLGYILGINFALAPSLRYLRMSLANGIPIQALEPVIILASSMWDSMFLFLGLIVCLADAPFISEATQASVMRSTRRRWMTASILYMFIVTVGYYLIVDLAAIVAGLQNAYLGNIWSNSIMKIVHQSEYTITQYQLFFEEPLFLKVFSPLQGFLLTFMCQVAYGFTLSMLMFLFNMFYRRAVGIAVTLIVHAFGHIIILEGMFINPKISLLLHALPACHNFNSDIISPYPTIPQSAIVFVSLSIILIGVLIYAAKWIDYRVPDKQI